MKLIFLASLISLVLASNEPWQVNNNGTISCEKLGTFCAGDSGKTNIIIHCQQVGSVGNYAGNCNDNLAGACGGVCEFAPCKQSCPDAGDGYCSVDGAIAPNGTTLYDPSEEQSTSETKRSLAAKLYES